MKSKVFTKTIICYELTKMSFSTLILEGYNNEKKLVK